MNRKMMGMSAAPAQASSREHSRCEHRSCGHHGSPAPTEPDPAPISIPKGIDLNEIELGIIR